VARLQHPNIVQIYDVGRHEYLSYVVLEYVAGGSLAQRLRTERPTPRASAEIVAKLARAVHHAHLEGVIHRDLKPSNALLTPDGQPKIADFGLAKIQSPQDDLHATRVGVVLGTPAYMAPEQAAGKAKEVGPAADIYSLGAILYELLTGRPPFQAESVMEMLSQLWTDDPPARPRTLNPAVDRDLETICLKCLEKVPAQRYASAADLADDLERWLADIPITAKSRKVGWWRLLVRRLPFRKQG
jgi:serine/threonine-protein kinase